MARKKMKPVSKATKNSAKRPTKNKLVSVADTMEKDFRAIPAKLTAEYRKELAVVKQQELKLKADLKKTQEQQKAAQQKYTLLETKAKTKSTAAAKKQILAAKKVYAATTKTIKDITASLDRVKKQIKTLADKQAKCTMLGKQLRQIEKEWDMKAKTTTTAKATATKQTRKKSVKKAVSTPAHKPSETFTEEFSVVNTAHEPVEVVS